VGEWEGWNKGKGQGKENEARMHGRGNDGRGFECGECLRQSKPIQEKSVKIGYIQKGI